MITPSLTLGQIQALLRFHARVEEGFHRMQLEIEADSFGE